MTSSSYLRAQGYNEKGAREKPCGVLNALVKHGPVNYGDDNQGGVYTGITLNQILAYSDS